MQRNSLLIYFSPALHTHVRIQTEGLALSANRPKRGTVAPENGDVSRIPKAIGRIEPELLSASMNR
jgi:hypothetical protein